MKALKLMAFFNREGRSLQPFRLYVVDKAVAHEARTTAYPVMHIDIDEVAKDILLVLRFPDEPERGAVMETVGEFLAAFLPAASDNPDFAVEASVPLQVMKFNRCDMPVVGLAGNDQERVALLLADGLDYLESLLSD